MARYIDADMAYETARMFNSDFGKSMADLTSLREVLEDTPTADVVKVVRCENCSHKVDFKGRVMCNKNARKIGGEWCGLTATNNNHFCSYGTPKESEVQGE